MYKHMCMMISVHTNHELQQDTNSGTGIWECLLHVSTFATTRVALPTGVKPG
jgi:hypothetical protein